MKADMRTSLVTYVQIRRDEVKRDAHDGAMIALRGHLSGGSLVKAADYISTMAACAYMQGVRDTMKKEGKS